MKTFINRATPSAIKHSVLALAQLKTHTIYQVSFIATSSEDVEVQMQLITYHQGKPLTKITHHPSRILKISAGTDSYKLELVTEEIMDGPADNYLSIVLLSKLVPGEPAQYVDFNSISVSDYRIFVRKTKDTIDKIVHVDTFGVKCGIATYLEGLLAGENGLVSLDSKIEHVIFAEEIPPGDDREATKKGYLVNWPRVIRNWHRKQSIERMIEDLKKEDPDILHIQHEWSFFNTGDSGFYNLLLQAKERGIVNVVTWHTVYGQETGVYSNYHRELADLIDMNIVHTKTCYRNLVAMGIRQDSIRHVPMWSYVRDIPGVNINKAISSTIPEKAEFRRRLLPEAYWKKNIIATGGFLLPNKGVEKLIMSIATLPNKNDIALVCIGGEHPWSLKVYLDYFELCKNVASQMGVDVVFDYRFMDDREIEAYLKCADIVVLNYGPTLSGTSGWSRRAIASGRPTITTDSLLFQDLNNDVHCLKVRSNNIGEMTGAIRTLLDDINNNGSALSRKLVSAALQYANEISIPSIAKKHLNIYNEICINIRGQNAVGRVHNPEQAGLIKLQR